MRPKNTPSDRTLTAVSALAHRAGLAVEWMPIVACHGGAPRMNILPNDMFTWWQRYKAMIDHYAVGAQRNGVEIYSVGSEYTALQKYTSNWMQIIHSVNAKFRGLTTYMATTGVGFPDLGWWGNLDLLSVSPYWSLSPAKIPTVDNLVHAWNYFLPQLKQQSTTYHRPILMDEIGYPSTEYAAYRPAVSWQNRGAKASQLAQANAYEALLKVSGEAKQQSWMRGVVWFFWKALSNPKSDRSYSPQGKKAERVVAKYWSHV